MLIILFLPDVVVEINRQSCQAGLIPLLGFNNSYDHMNIILYILGVQT